MNMQNYLFYATNLFLEKVTLENFSNPKDIRKTEHYWLYYLLFMYKVRKKRDILYIPHMHLRKFSDTKHHSNFQSNPILCNALEEDKTYVDGNHSSDDELLVECATYKSGIEGEHDIIIICCKEEIKRIQALAEKHKYPVQVKTPSECRKLFE